MRRTYPFYIKSAAILLALVLMAYILCSLKAVFIPLALSLLISVLLNPLVNILEKWKVPHALAISITLLSAFILATALVYFLSSQIMGFFK